MFVRECKKSVPIKKYQAHSHSCWEIVYQLDGEVITHVGDKKLTLKKGNILLIPPKVIHSGNSEHDFCDLSMLIDGIDFEKLSILHDSRGEIITIISIIHRLMSERQGDYTTLSESLAEAAIKMIHFEMDIVSYSPSVDYIKKEIYKNLSNPNFDISMSIASVGFHKDYFRRLFKSEIGKTPSQYMTDLRITRAKQLLSDKKMFSISSISELCGFSDNLYFSTCFKKHVGISPTNYRKNKLKLN